MKLQSHRLCPNNINQNLKKIMKISLRYVVPHKSNSYNRIRSVGRNKIINILHILIYLFFQAEFNRNRSRYIEKRPIFLLNFAFCIFLEETV